MKRVMIFWDFSNFRINLDNLAGRNKSFDYAEFAKALQGNDELVKIYFACSKLKEENLLEGFFKTIDYMPFFKVNVFERDMDKKTQKNPEKQVDVYLATQMVALAYEDAYDVAYLVSGDEDYVPAVDIVQQKGKVVVAVSANISFSKLLKRRADKFIVIDDKDTSKNKTFYYKNFLLA